VARRYQRLSAAAVDEIWVRLRKGHAANPIARQLGLPEGTVRAYLVRCGGLRPDPRCRSTGRLSLEEREEISRGSGRRAVAARDRGRPEPLGLDDQPGGGLQRWPAPLPRCRRGPGGVVAGDSSQGVQTCGRPGAGWHRGGEASATLVAGTDRRLAEGDLPRRLRHARVPREHLPHPVRAGARCAAR
jgi:hypothetical protein